MQGYIKLYRKLLESQVFQNEKLLKIFVWCLLKATHKGYTQVIGRQTITLEPGQFAYGRKAAAQELNLPESTVRDYMQILKNDKTITIKSTNKFSVVTLVNWDFYQGWEEEPDNKPDSKPDNRWTTNGQQMDTNNNDKNGKKVKNEYTTDFESFWTIYPNKKEKAKAFKCFNARLKEKEHTVEDMLKAAENYSLDCKAKGTAQEYIKHAATFLGPNKPFTDYINWTPPKPQGPNPGGGKSKKVSYATDNKFNGFVL